MTVTETAGGVRVVGSDIDLHKTFDCGQCFRFTEREDGSFFGVAHGRVLDITQDAEGFFVSDMTAAEFDSRWRVFFDLERDYSEVRRLLADTQLPMTAMDNGAGIHILRQDPWETLCSFIISQNNNIPRIKKIVESLCALLGEEISDGVYAFPTAEAVAAAGVEGIAPIKSGFRAKYIVDAAKRVADGRLDLESLKAGSFADADAALQSVMGVGPKVAGCVALFGLSFTEAFPIDVWIKRVIAKYYDADFSPTVFGEYAGIAQQYLFYNERFVQ